MADTTPHQQLAHGFRGALDDMHHNAEVRAVQNAISTLERCAASVARKHTWRPTEKAMAVASYTMDIAALQRVLDRLTASSPAS